MTTDAPTTAGKTNYFKHCKCKNPAIYRRLILLIGLTTLCVVTYFKFPPFVWQNIIYDRPTYGLMKMVLMCLLLCTLFKCQALLKNSDKTICLISWLYSFNLRCLSRESFYWTIKCYQSLCARCTTSVISISFWRLFKYASYLCAESGENMNAFSDQNRLLFNAKTKCMLVVIVTTWQYIPNPVD